MDARIALASLVQVLFQAITMAIVARVLLSWFPIRQDSPLAVLLFEVTEPILGPLRRIIPRLGMLDISPFVACLLVSVLQGVVVNAIRGG